MDEFSLKDESKIDDSVISLLESLNFELFLFPKYFISDIRINKKTICVHHPFFIEHWCVWFDDSSVFKWIFLIYIYIKMALSAQCLVVSERDGHTLFWDIKWKYTVLKFWHLEFINTKLLDKRITMKDLYICFRWNLRKVSISNLTVCLHFS